MFVPPENEIRFHIQYVRHSSQYTLVIHWDVRLLFLLYVKGSLEFEYPFKLSVMLLVEWLSVYFLKKSYKINNQIVLNY